MHRWQVVSPGARGWLGLGVLALPTLLLSMDQSVLYLALPELTADLRPSAAQELWITDIYGFMIAGFLITMGNLGDRIGRRRLLMIGAAAFGAASVLAAYATSAETLIAARALLGIAGATQMPSTLALIRSMFADPKQRALAVGVWVSYFTAGTAIGPMIGGVLLESYWWGSVFLVGVPVMLVLMVAAPLLLPESRDPAAGPLDLTSVALSLAAILPVVYGLKELAGAGVGASPVLAIAAGLLAGAVFAGRQRRLAAPLLDLSLFGHRGFGPTLVIMVVGLVALGGTYLFGTQYLQTVQGLSPLTAAMWLVPAAVADVIGAMLAPIIARRIAAGRVIAAGLGVSATGFVVLATAGPGSALAVPVIGLGLMSIGISPTITLGTDLVVGAAPAAKAGAASSISETGTELGVALGVATLGTLGTAVYRAGLGDGVPAGVPAESVEAAKESIAGALDVAGQLPPPLGAELVESAREAFTTGLNVVAAAGAGLSIALAVLSLVAFRRPGRPASEEVVPPEPEPGRTAGRAAK